MLRSSIEFVECITVSNAFALIHMFLGRDLDWFFAQISFATLPLKLVIIWEKLLH